MAEVMILREAFAPPGPRDRFTAPPEASLAELAPGDDGCWVCTVDGRHILREHWHYAPPPGAEVRFTDWPQGGGKGGSNPLQILVMLAASVVAPYLAGAFLNTAVGGALASAVGTGVVKGLVSLGVNAAFGSLAANLAGGSRASADAAGQQYSARIEGNLARLDQPVPECFGWNERFPPFAAPPYALFDADDDQTVHALLMVGEGEHLIKRVSIGDTPYQHYQDVEVVRIGPGQSTREGPGTGIETLAALTLVQTNLVTSQDVAGIEMPSKQWVGPHAAIRPEFAIDGVGIDMVLPRGLSSGKSIEWQVQGQRIDDFGAALADWVVIGSEVISGKHVLPVRRSFFYPVAAGRWQVRVQRTDTRSTDDNSNHDIVWAGLRGRLVGAGVDYSGATFVAVKGRASGQFSGGRFKVMHERLLPVWSGSAWSAPQLTRNPAWAACHVLRTRGVPDADIDLAQWLALAGGWAARQDRFDWCFDAAGSSWEALSAIARVGRAVPLVRNSRVTAVRDEQQTMPVAMYSQRNMRRGSWEITNTFAGADPVQAIDLEYLDHRRGDWVTVTAQVHAGTVYAYRGDPNRPAGVPAPDPLARSRHRVPGIIGEQHALREAAFAAAQLEWRTREAVYATELDGQIPAVWSLVVLQHALGDFGTAADVADWNAATLTITATEPMPWAGSAAHAIRLQKPDGTPTAPIDVTRGAGDHELVLASAPGFTPVWDDADRERTRIVFGPQQMVGAYARTREIKHRSGGTFEHRAVLEDDRVHLADNPWLPGAGEQDPPPSGAVVVPGGGTTSVVNLTARTLYDSAGGSSGETPGIEVALLSDGRLRVTYDVLGPGFVQYFAGEWFSSAISASRAADFEALAEVSSYSVGGSSPTTGGSFGVWLGLGTSPAWRADIGAGSDQRVTFLLRLRIRNTVGHAEQADRTLTLELSTTPGGA